MTTRGSSGEMIPPRHPALSFSTTWLDTVPSTNDLVLNRIRSGTASAGEVWAAREQPGARGRQGRRWVASNGGLWFTTALPLAGQAVGWAGMLAALAICEALEELGLTAGVKWPNDVVVGGRKLAGVLVETVAGRKLAAVGVGLNVSNEVVLTPGLAQASTPEGHALILPDSGGTADPLSRVAPFSHSANRASHALVMDNSQTTPIRAWPPTSVYLETGLRPEPEVLLSLILARLEAFWMLWLDEALDPLRERWDVRDISRGLRVRLLPAGPTGVAESIDRTGALLVRLSDGKLHRAVAGELVFI